MLKSLTSIFCFILIFSAGAHCFTLQSRQKKSEKFSKNKQSLRAISDNNNTKGRLVDKFYSIHKKLPDVTFADAQNKNTSRNLNVQLSNKSMTYTFSTKYSNYNLYGLKNNSFETTTQKNKHSSIVVGVELLKATLVRVNVAGHKSWVNLDPAKTIPPINPKNTILSSIAYEIDAIGNSINPSITMNRTYWTRPQGGIPSVEHRDKYGTFPVYNTNNHIKHSFLSRTGQICIGVAIGAVGAIFVFGGILLSVWRCTKKEAITIATDLTRADIESLQSTFSHDSIDGEGISLKGDSNEQVFGSEATVGRSCVSSQFDEEATIGDGDVTSFGGGSTYSSESDSIFAKRNNTIKELESEITDLEGDGDIHNAKIQDLNEKLKIKREKSETEISKKRAEATLKLKSELESGKKQLMREFTVNDEEYKATRAKTIIEIGALAKTEENLFDDCQEGYRELSELTGNIKMERQQSEVLNAEISSIVAGSDNQLAQITDQHTALDIQIASQDVQKEKITQEIAQLEKDHSYLKSKQEQDFLALTQQSRRQTACIQENKKLQHYLRQQKTRASLRESLSFTREVSAVHANIGGDGNLARSQVVKKAEEKAKIFAKKELDSFLQLEKRHPCETIFEQEPKIWNNYCDGVYGEEGLSQMIKWDALYFSSYVEKGSPALVIQDIWELRQYHWNGDKILFSRE